MEKINAVLQTIVPIFTVIFLGMLAHRRRMLTQEENKGLEQFVMKFGLPCVLFNSCLTCNLGPEAVTSMMFVPPFILFCVLWAFKAGKKKYPYHNLPMMFSAQESGMLGIPLVMSLFGAEQAYRMGVLDLAQSFVVIPVIAILTADVSERLSPGTIVKKVLQSPFLIMSLLGLILNLSGAAEVLNRIGAGDVLVETTSFVAQPVSAVILFSVGYNFSLNRENLKQILKISAQHFGVYTAFGILMQGVLFLLPSVDAETRWAFLIYTTLPVSFLAPALGKTEEDYTVASGVCSLMTVLSLLVFCVIAAIVV